MKEIYANDSIVGLSREEVVERLGKSIEMHQYNRIEQEYYIYNAGNIYVGIIWGKHNIFTTKHGYHFTVCFDKTNKVKSTAMREDT